MKKLVLIFTCAALATGGAYAQNKLVDEVKSEIGGMNANSSTFKNARGKIKVALSNEETIRLLHGLLPERVGMVSTISAWVRKQSESKWMIKTCALHCLKVMNIS